MNLSTAKIYADEVIKVLRPYCERIEVAGSIRRRCPDVNDIEVVYMLKRDESRAWGADQVTRLWLKICDTWKVVKGHRGGLYIRVRLKDVGIEVDLFQATRDNWGVIYAIRTGSADFSHKVLARTWSKMGYHSDGGILYEVIENKSAKCKTDILDVAHPIYLREEEDVFRFLGMSWVPPEMRL